MAEFYWAFGGGDRGKERCAGASISFVKGERKGVVDGVKALYQTRRQGAKGRGERFSPESAADTKH